MKVMSVFSAFLPTLFIIPFCALSQTYSVNFSASPVVVCVGQPVQFSDLTPNNPTAWYWTL